MFSKKKSSAHAFTGSATTPSPAPRPQRKRNRSVEQMRRRTREYQRSLYARASALHDAADASKQDDEDARCNEEIPTTCIHRIKARQIEAIADRLYSAVCGK